MFALVVDDDAAVRAFVQSILQADDFDTLEAENGDDALEMVRCLDGRLGLLITDLQMAVPDDGLRLARAVRQEFPDVPIILMSGYPDPGSPFRFVSKPFSWIAMRNIVRRVLEPARAA